MKLMAVFYGKAPGERVICDPGRATVHDAKGKFIVRFADIPGGTPFEADHFEYVMVKVGRGQNPIISFAPQSEQITPSKKENRK